jgi:hypothetical protein
MCQIQQIADPHNAVGVITEQQLLLTNRKTTCFHIHSFYGRRTSTLLMPTPIGSPNATNAAGERSIIRVQVHVSVITTVMLFPVRGEVKINSGLAPAFARVLQ